MKAPALPVTKDDILSSVMSLYADELKCFGRVLLKRLRERAAAKRATDQGLPENAVDPETMPRLNPNHLRKLCESCRRLVVEPEEGREFSVVLVGQPCPVLDVCSPVDVYPEEFWDTFSAYLGNFDVDEVVLPGGRYACARVLSGRLRLSFLQGYSLGQVCHIVQIAISQRRLLGYNDQGHLCPYRHSKSWVKEQCASVNASRGQDEYPVVSWMEARALLRELLKLFSAEAEGVLLSSLKRLFRLHFQRELSETALGHIRLLDVMRDPRLSDLCTFQSLTNSQTVLRAVKSPSACPTAPPGMWAIAIPTLLMPTLPGAPTSEDLGEARFLVSPGTSPRNSVSSGECFHFQRIADESTTEGGSLHSGASSELDETDYCIEVDESPKTWSVEVRNTFIDLRSTGGLGLSSSSKHRRRSVPASLCA